MNKPSNKKRKKVIELILIVQIVLIGIAFCGKSVAHIDKDEPNFTNVVVFVSFKDSDHSHTSQLGECFTINPQKTFELFNGDENHKRGMKQFLYNMSFGQFNLENVFPNYNEETNKIEPFVFPNDAAYYIGNDGLLLSEVENQLKLSKKLSDDINIDRNNDGYIDNLTIVVSCENGTTNTEFYGHQAFSGSGNVNNSNKLIGNYNVVTEGEVYFGMGGSGLITHEFLHTIGYPDLYRKRGDSNVMPVGTWDIMASQSYRVQYPLAYLRSSISDWFDIPEVTQTTKNYTLTAVSEATEHTKNNQAVILKTPYSDTEFFVIEYRKKGNAYTNGSELSQDYEVNIPGSGIIIYRVNTAYETNISGPPDMIYVFRQGEKLDDNGNPFALSSQLSQSFLSEESGRTTFGKSDLDKTIVDGAITYTDGTNSGIVISNVGSTSGDTISFDITFTDLSEKDYWTSISNDLQIGEFSYKNSAIDSNGNIYYILKDYNDLSYKLYKCSNLEKFEKIGDVPRKADNYNLCEYNGKLYCIYVSEGYVYISLWNDTYWKDVYKSEYSANEVGMCADYSGIYLCYTNSYSNKYNEIKAYAVKYSIDGIINYGEVYQSSKYSSNPSVGVYNGEPIVLLREAFGDNKMTVRKYSNGKWNSFGDINISANYAKLKVNADKAYIMTNGGTTYDSAVYLYDFTKANSKWIQVGNLISSKQTISELDINFVGNIPYIAYTNWNDKQTYVSLLEGKNWVHVGEKISSDDISGLELYTYKGKAIVTYINQANNKITIRTHNVKDECSISGHSWLSTWTIDKKPTCVSEGSKSHHCIVCNEKSDITIINKIAHTYGSEVITINPTCNSQGIKTYTCIVCGNTKNEIMKNTNHKYSTTIVLPTYSTKGYTLHKCNICGNSYKDRYIDKKKVGKVSIEKSYTSTTSSIYIRWNKVSKASGYRIYRWNGKKWAKVIDLGCDSLLYRDTKKKAGTQYKYKVRAYVQKNGVKYWGENSNEIKAATRPNDVKIKKKTISSKSAKIYWNKVACTGYKIQKYNTKTKTWQTIKTITSKNIGFKVSGLRKNTTYKFRIQPYKKCEKNTIKGNWTNIVFKTRK